MAHAIKLNDFATQQGVTTRQVQRLLQKYDEELDGLYERKGPNGTWLTPEACEILRSKMRQHPMVVFEPDPRVAELEAKIEKLEAERKSLVDQMLVKESSMAALIDQNKALQEKANTALLLEAGKQAAEDREKLVQAEAELLRQQLETEKIRPLTWRERITGKKG